MRLWVTTSDSQAYSNALLGLDTPPIEDASRSRRDGLPDYRFDREGSQGSSENDDGNEAFGTVSSCKGTHFLTCGHREQI